MSLSTEFLSEDQFTCSICLDIFTNPVSTPCGHSFCLSCITSYWEGQVKTCLCPLCKESFRKCPELHINHTLKEITEQFKRMAESTGSPRSLTADTPTNTFSVLKPGVQNKPELPERLFSEMRSRFQKSASCDSVVSPQPLLASNVSYSSPAFMAPNQSPSVIRTNGGGSSGPQCPRHGQNLELFCKNDQTSICALCAEREHQGHSVVDAKRDMTIKKSQLRIMEVELQGLITVREKKIEEIQTSLAEIQVNAEREAVGTVRMFGALMSAVERSQAELLEVVEMGRRAAELRSQAFIRDLQMEISELRKRCSTLNQLVQSQDHLTFFKTYPVYSSFPVTKSWAEVALTPDPTSGVVLRNVTQMVEEFQERLQRLSEICLHSTTENSLENDQTTSLVGGEDYVHTRGGESVKSTGSHSFSMTASVSRRREAAQQVLGGVGVRWKFKCSQHYEMWRVQEYAMDFTLDRDSAHPRLIISEDGKQVRCSDRYQNVADTPERFDRVVCVLGCLGFSSGRHYWEVQVGEKTDWDLGMASRSINRKGKIAASPANGFWFLSLRDKQDYVFRTEPSTPIYLNPKPQRIGVFVDYEKGQMSFFNADTKSQIFTFTDTFTDTLYPFFSPCTNKSGKNEAPLIICPTYPADRRWLTEKLNNMGWK